MGLKLKISNLAKELEFVVIMPVKMQAQGVQVRFLLVYRGLVWRESGSIPDDYGI